jgi:hypothetical protein
LRIQDDPQPRQCWACQGTRTRRSVRSAQDQREGRAHNQNTPGRWEWHLKTAKVLGVGTSVVQWIKATLA